MNWSEKDLEYNWHPYTQHKGLKELPVIVKGKGEFLWDTNGKRYIDGIASWWVNPFGHSNPVLAEAIYNQLNTLEHVLFGGFTHTKAIELSERLLGLLPSNQKKVFYSDNGSTAVEIAIKAALQFFYNKGLKKTKIIAFENAFHGDTFGAMAASGISFFTEAFKNSLIEVERIPVPTKGNEERCIKQFETLVKTDGFACFIFEPLVLGAAGMQMYDAEPLNQLITIAKQNQVFTIADEVMTGFGKTGKTFACEYLSQQPDMMCLSKALTGGTIPMAVTSFSEEVFLGFYDDDVNKALFHGHTFTANPTGCAAALATINLLLTDEMQGHIKRVHQSHLKFLKQLEGKKVANIRVLGVILAFELEVDGKHDYYGDLRNRLYQFFIEQGVILRPVGNTIYVLPPYTISDESLNIIYQKILEGVDKFGEIS
ncbi:adenosylmethionine--8-amino-7-oxononanoate transaminase [Riemerella anatipestifer]|nr:adenosylmethionine--8-amino-7-oxononanoate transaminase [Riemerella anatipestifer]MDY3325823.1 adenosylmethionine--8-amino-7-oxononanoate transaminase [Riemerella anatipestifer]MDY3354365.1 adenosylmethionine--8-amino-7-oxononanoate transaminase [Riemerella anatipestifer]